MSDNQQPSPEEQLDQASAALQKFLDENDLPYNKETQAKRDRLMTEKLIAEMAVRSAGKSGSDLGVANQHGDIDTMDHATSGDLGDELSFADKIPPPVFMPGSEQVANQQDGNNLPDLPQ